MISLNLCIKIFRECFIKLVKFLLKKGYDINWKDAEGYTALHWAVQEGHLETVELLIENGCDINIMDAAGHTPLYVAAGENRSEIGMKEKNIDYISPRYKLKKGYTKKGGMYWYTKGFCLDKRTSFGRFLRYSESMPDELYELEMDGNEIPIEDKYHPKSCLKKALIILASLIIILACGGFKANPVNTMTKNEEVKNNTVSKFDSKENPYFKESYFDNTVYSCYFSTYKEYRGFLSLKCEKILDLQEGQVYELKFKGYVPESLMFPKERFSLGYFYVKQDKIYRMNVMEKTLEQIKKGKIPEESYIICQDKEIKEGTDAEKEKDGIHYYMEADGKIRKSHYYIMVRELDYYETFTWKENEGLTYYCSGYGALSDHVELKKIGRK